MRNSMYNNLDIKIQVLENKLNNIMKDTRYSRDLNDFYPTKKYKLAESIKNLLKLTEGIKNELHYYLKSVPKSTKTEHLYRKVCILESELYNLLYNYREKPTNEVSSFDSEDSCRPCKARVRTPSESQSFKKKFISHRREPKYDVWESSSDSQSPTNISCYFSSSGSSSSLELLNYQKRVPVYIRKSKNSFQDQSPIRREVRHPSKAPVYIRKSKSSIQDRYPVQRERSHPSRLPVYIRKSKYSLQDRPLKEKEGKHYFERDRGYKKKSRAKPMHNCRRVKKRKTNSFWKRSSSQFEKHKSDSDKANAGTDDLQTEEVFLIKKKQKSKSRIQSEKKPSRGRVLISRLERVKSSKSKPRLSERNGSIKERYSTENYKEEKYPAANSSNKRFGIAKYKDSKAVNGEIRHSYSNESFYVLENRDRKNSRSKVPRRVKIRSQLSKPITVARSVNLGNNPFINNNNHILYLQDSSFILVPNKKLYNIHANVESISKSSNNNVAHMSSSKSYNLLNQKQKVSSNNYNNNVSNNKILDSFQHLSSSLIENSSHVKEQYGSVSTNTLPDLKTYQIPHKTVFFSEVNKLNSSRNNAKPLFYNDPGMKVHSKSNEQSKSKLILLKIVGNKNHDENKTSCSNQTNKSLGRKGNSFQSAPVRNNTSKVKKGTTVPTVLENTIDKKNGKHNSFHINNTSWGNVDNSIYVLNSNGTQNEGFFKSVLDLSKENYSTHLVNTPRNNISSSNSKPSMVLKTGSKVLPTKALSKDSKNNRPELNKAISLLKTKSLPKLLSEDENKTLLRNQSTTSAASRAGSNISLNRTNSKAKSKNWLTRSVSKLSVLAKRTKKPKVEKAEKSLSKEIYAIDLSEENKQNSEEKLPSTENVSKNKSWTKVKRVMSGASSFIKLGKNKKKEKQVPLKKSESEIKQKKKPLLKRMFSKTRSKTEMVGDSKAKLTNKSEYGEDLTSSSQSSVTQNQYAKDLQRKGNLEDKHVYGYKVGSKPNNQVLNTKSFKSKPILTMNEASHKQPTIQDNPKPYNYSLHYSKKKHKCVEMRSVPSLPCLVSYKCSPDSKVLWTMDQTDLNERQLNEFEKCNNYHEFLFKPIACKCCVIHDKKVSKSCQERGEKTIFSDCCPSFVSDDKSCHGLINCKLTSESDQLLSEGSDICDWKKIANEIK